MFSYLSLCPNVCVLETSSYVLLLMRMSSVSNFFMSVELPFWENEEGRREVGDLRDKDEDVLMRIRTTQTG